MTTKRIFNAVRLSTRAGKVQRVPPLRRDSSPAGVAARLDMLERRCDRLEWEAKLDPLRALPNPDATVDDLAFAVPVDLQTGRSRSAIAVREGWRRCRRSGGKPHLWNTQTVALNTVEQPRDLRRVPFEDCPAHRIGARR